MTLCVKEGIVLLKLISLRIRMTLSQTHNKHTYYNYYY